MLQTITAKLSILLTTYHRGDQNSGGEVPLALYPTIGIILIFAGIEKSRRRKKSLSSGVRIDATITDFGYEDNKRTIYFTVQYEVSDDRVASKTFRESGNVLQTVK